MSKINNVKRKVFRQNIQVQNPQLKKSQLGY